MFRVTFTLAETGTHVSFYVTEGTVLDEMASTREHYMRLGYTISGIVVWR